MATIKDGTLKGDLAPDDEGAKAFAHLLTTAEDGQYHADLTKEAQKLLVQLREHAHVRGKARGELVLSIKFAVDDSDVVSLETTYKVKAPSPPRHKTTRWLTPGGNLTPSNPKQIELGLRPVPAPKTTDAADPTTPKTRSI